MHTQKQLFIFFITKQKVQEKNKHYRPKLVFPQSSSGDIARNTALDLFKVESAERIERNSKIFRVILIINKFTKTIS